MIQFTRHGRTAEVSIVGNVGESRSRTARQITRLVNISLSADAGRLDLYEEIDPDFGMSAVQFSRNLSSLGPVDVIDLYLNSPGGSVFDALAIHSMLQRHPATVAVHVDGVAASAASFIAMAGDSIDMVQSGRMMVHNAQAFVAGDHKDMRAVADILQSLSGTIAGIYAARTGQPKSAFLKAMDQETWYDAPAALQAGLIDRIVPLVGRSKNSSVKSRLAQIERDDSTYLDRYSVAARLRQIDRDAVAVH